MTNHSGTKVHSYRLSTLDSSNITAKFSTFPANIQGWRKDTNILGALLIDIKRLDCWSMHLYLNSVKRLGEDVAPLPYFPHPWCKSKQLKFQTWEIPPTLIIHRAVGRCKMLEGHRFTWTRGLLKIGGHSYWFLKLLRGGRARGSVPSMFLWP